jgi:hypothetical protein
MICYLLCDALISSSTKWGDISLQSNYFLYIFLSSITLFTVWIMKDVLGSAGLQLPLQQSQHSHSANNHK